MCTPHLLGRHSSCARYASMVSLIDSEAKGSMRDFVLVKLTDEEFDDFSARHPQGNFQQTSRWDAFAPRRGSTSNIWPSRRARRSSRRRCSKLTALDSLHLRPSMMARCGDYHDTEALTFFMDALKRHAKAKGASQLEITPESPYRLRDTNGASLPDDQNGAPDNKLIERLEAIGFTHGGFTVGYTAVPRWRYLKDLTGITDEKVC